MTTVKNIDSFMSAFAPRELSESWDNDGVMLCKDTEKNVKCALICLEVNLPAIEKAIEIGADLIITHHPFIFKPLKSLSGEAFSEIELLVKHGISVLSYHTRLDKADGGVNSVLAETLGLSNVAKKGEFLYSGELCCAMSGEEFATYIKEKLGCESIKAYFEKGAKIKTVALCGGAGKDFLFEAAECAVAFVSADFSHNTFIDAKNLGIAVFDAGHYHTENSVIYKLKSLLEAEFTGVSFECFDVGCPFFTR